MRRERPPNQIHGPVQGGAIEGTVSSLRFHHKPRLLQRARGPHGEQDLPAPDLDGPPAGRVFAEFF